MNDIEKPNKKSNLDYGRVQLIFSQNQAKYLKEKSAQWFVLFWTLIIIKYSYFYLLSFSIWILSKQLEFDFEKEYEVHLNQFFYE